MSLIGHSEQSSDSEPSSSAASSQTSTNNGEDSQAVNDSSEEQDVTITSNVDDNDDDDDEDDEGTTVLIRFADLDDQEEDSNDDGTSPDANESTGDDDAQQAQTTHDQEGVQYQRDPTGDHTLELPVDGQQGEVGYVENSSYDFTAEISPRKRNESVNFDKKLLSVQSMADRQRKEFEKGRQRLAAQPRPAENSRRVFKESTTEVENQRKRQEEVDQRLKRPTEITKMCVYYDLSLIRTETDIQAAMDYLRGKVPPQASYLFDTEGNLIESQLFASTPAVPSTTSTSVSRPTGSSEGSTPDNVQPTAEVQQEKPSKTSKRAEATKEKPAAPLPDYMSPEYAQPLSFENFLAIIKSQVPPNLKARFPKDGLFSGKGYKKHDHPILFYHQYIFDTKFDPNNRLHVLLLNSVYMRLMDETTPPPLTGEHWVKNSICCDENPANSLKVRGIVDLIKPRQYKSNDFSIYPLFVGLYLLDGINDKSASDVFKTLLRSIHKRSEPALEVCIFDFFICVAYVMRFYHHKCVSKFIPQIIVDYNKEQYRYVRGERTFEAYLFYMIEFLSAGLLTKYYRNYLTLNTLISAAISLREMLFNDTRGLERLLHDPVPAGVSRALVSFVPGSYQLFLSEIGDESYYQIPLSVPFLSHLRKRGIDIKKEEQIQSKYKPTQGAEISTHRSSLYVPVVQYEKPEREVGKPTIHRNDGKSVKGGKHTPPPPPAAAIAAAGVADKEAGNGSTDDLKPAAISPEHDSDSSTAGATLDPSQDPEATTSK